MSTTRSPALREFGGNNVRPIIDGLKGNSGLIVIVAAFCAMAMVVQYILLGHQGSAILFSRQQLSSPFTFLTGTFVFGFFLLHPLYVMIFVRPERLTAYIVEDLRTRYLTAGRLTQGLTVLILMQPFISAFSALKTLIPTVNPFYLDEYFMELDRLLHGGMDPWVLLHPLLASPFISSALNFSYNIWFFVLFGMLFWQAFSQKNQERRLQFFYAFLSLWIFLGIVAATLLSSAGPVYYGRVTGLADPYAPLMAYLHQANALFPIWSLEVQDILWSSYSLGTDVAGKGISAMPSLHVAVVTLFALVGWGENRWMGAIFTTFALLILIGSVHLGWHYAVDGYVSIVLTGFIWWVAGKWVRRSKKSPLP
ncbi:MAG: phosphatase PAP2 family protein [Rhodospirillaceae bacterium]|jgi:hypothetical protein|nr:phosphatase PAP2 family protein [Rhodospirillaceae bacterium]MBT5459907.1 phosphatase PAP2 family protein [Rhodospirillaceae bacterium]